MASYWTIILEEVHNYESQHYHCRYSNLQETDIFVEKMEEEQIKRTPQPPKITYSLPAPFSHLHLTEREAECIFCLQQNHTIKSTGVLLNLSARTVEFYLNNIKSKMQLRTKIELLNHLQNMDFLLFDKVHDNLSTLIENSSLYPRHSAPITLCKQTYI